MKNNMLRFNKRFAAYVKIRGYFDGTSSFTDAVIERL